MKIEDSGVLVKTGSAAPILGVSVQTLRAYRDLQGGFLIEGKHWFSGAFDNSPITVSYTHLTLPTNREV